MSEPTSAEAGPGAVRRWTILACSLLAAMATATVVNGPAFLIPELHRTEGMPLGTAAVLAAAPMVGLMVTTVPWGWALDRWGEREILLISLATSALAAAGAAIAAASGSGIWTVGALLLVAGAASASTNGASGRIVVGWFPANQRGTAMGIRQMAQPLGVGLSAITMPVLAEHHGVGAGIAVSAVASGIAVVTTVFGIADPPRASPAAEPTAAANPYRKSRFLVRVHLVSVLLVIPQMTLWTFVPVWLIVDRGWEPAIAGVLVTATQILGALGRIAAGRWSDVVGSRMRPIRMIAVAATLLTMALALADWIGTPVAIPIMVAASVVTVADNGLAFTAIAEYAGPRWSGRGLAIQNTGQYLAGSAAVPLIGRLISAVGYPAAFAVAGLAPLLAIAFVPRDRRRADDVDPQIAPGRAEPTG